MTFTRTCAMLFRTPLVRQPSTSSSSTLVELSTFSTSSPASPMRARAYSRSTISAPVYARRPSLVAAPSASGYRVNVSRGYASEKGQKELYSDEAGSTGAGTSDVAKTDAAFDGSKTNPETAAKGIEQETGKDFTRKSPANEEYSKPNEDGQELKPKGENK